MSAWLIQTLIASTLLMVLVLLMRAPVARAFGPRAAYALWLLPALRMILPPLPGLRAWCVPIVSIGPHKTAIGLVDVASAARFAPPASAAGMVTPVPILHPAPPPDVAHDLAIALLVVWLGVAAFWFAWQMLRYRHFLRSVLADAAPLATECGVDVLVSPAVAGPAAVGILRRRILLPVNFLARYTPEERRLALLHEAAHHDRLDIVANLAALAILALHWWNPVAWRAWRLFRADQELACDATVLAGADAGARQAYGYALIKSATARMPAMACALNPKCQLKHRIGMIMTHPPGRARLFCGGALVAAAIGGALLMTASGIAAPPVPAVVAPIAPVAPVAPPEPLAPVTPVPPVAPTAPPAPPAPPAVRISSHSVPGTAERRDIDRTVAEARAGARDAERQARAAEREARAAQTRVERIDVPRLVRTSLAAARRGLADQCAAQGVSMPAGADFDTLATCGLHMRETIRVSLAHARAAIAAAHGSGERQRSEALTGLDEALADLDRELPSQ